MRIEIVDLTRGGRDIVVVQEVGIPGPQGTPGDLSTTVILPPLEYDAPSFTLRIAPGTQIGQVIEWDGSAWVASPPQRVEHRTITAAEEAAKALTLSHPCTKPDQFLFDVWRGGGTQFPDADFELVAADVLSWDGLSLDGLLAEGDKVRLVYQ